MERSCRELGELIADGLDAGFTALLTEFEQRGQDFGAPSDTITREVAFLEVFIVERAVNRMITERSVQEAVLSAFICRLLSRSGILPGGSSFQQAYDSRSERYSLYWQQPLDSTGGMALASEVLTLSGASTDYELLMYFVQRIAQTYTNVLELLHD